MVRCIISCCVCCIIWTMGRAAIAGDGAARESLQQAAAYLWSQQADDGGWHSPQYGVLKSGQALTPFVLHALLNVPRPVAPRRAGAVTSGVTFIRQHVDDDAALGRDDPELLEYPVYSTAYALQCLTLVANDRALLTQAPTLRHADYATLRARMATFLSSAQFDEADGFTPSHPAYGGWGFDAPPSPGDPGHMDLAHTRRALQAIAPYFGTKIPRKRPDLARAEQFLRVVQRHPAAMARPVELPGAGIDAGAPAFDGGFYFSPVVLAANKGPVKDNPAPHWRSYATATCDGILALLAAGVRRDDERVTAAVKWLEEHTDVNYPQGVPRDRPEPWGEAIRFYHYAVRAEVYRKLDFPAEERAKLAAAVVRRQRPDGSFVNTASPLMKEDDPLLCTALAVIALANCLP